MYTYLKMNMYRLPYYNPFLEAGEWCAKNHMVQGCRELPLPNSPPAKAEAFNILLFNNKDVEEDRSCKSWGAVGSYSM